MKKSIQQLFLLLSFCASFLHAADPCHRLKLTLNNKLYRINCNPEKENLAAALKRVGRDFKLNLGKDEYVAIELDGKFVEFKDICKEQLKKCKSVKITSRKNVN